MCIIAVLIQCLWCVHDIHVCIHSCISECKLCITTHKIYTNVSIGNEITSNLQFA